MDELKRRSWADPLDRNGILEVTLEEHRKLGGALYRAKDEADRAAITRKIEAVARRTTVLMMAKARDEDRHLRRQKELQIFAMVSLDHMGRAVETAMASGDHEIGATLATEFAKKARMACRHIDDRSASKVGPLGALYQVSFESLRRRGFKSGDIVGLSAVIAAARAVPDGEVIKLDQQKDNRSPQMLAFRDVLDRFVMPQLFDKSEPPSRL